MDVKVTPTDDRRPPTRSPSAYPLTSVGLTVGLTGFEPCGRRGVDRHRTHARKLTALLGCRHSSQRGRANPTSVGIHIDVVVTHDGDHLSASEAVAVLGDRREAECGRRLNDQTGVLEEPPHPSDDRGLAVGKPLSASQIGRPMAPTQQGVLLDVLDGSGRDPARGRGQPRAKTAALTPPSSVDAKMPRLVRLAYHRRSRA